MSKQKVTFVPYQIMVNRNESNKITELTDEQKKDLITSLNNLKPNKAKIVFGLIKQHSVLYEEHKAPVFGKTVEASKEMPYSGKLVKTDDKLSDIEFKIENLPMELLI